MRPDRIAGRVCRAGLRASARGGSGAQDQCGCSGGSAASTRARPWSMVMGRAVAAQAGVVRARQVAGYPGVGLRNPHARLVAGCWWRWRCQATASRTALAAAESAWPRAARMPAAEETGQRGEVSSWVRWLPMPGRVGFAVMTALSRSPVRFDATATSRIPAAWMTRSTEPRGNSASAAASSTGSLVRQAVIVTWAPSRSAAPRSWATPHAAGPLREDEHRRRSVLGDQMLGKIRPSTPVPR